MNLKKIFPILVAAIIGIVSFAGSWTTAHTTVTEPNFVGEVGGVLDIDSGEVVYSPEFSFFKVKDHIYEHYIYVTTNGDSVKYTVKMQTYQLGGWKDIKTVINAGETASALVITKDTMGYTTASDRLRFSYTFTIYGGDTTGAQAGWKGLNKRYY